MADIFDLFKKISSDRTEPSGKITDIVVGLGNPGEKYEHTRHNAGFLAMDHIAEKRDIGTFKTKFKALCADKTVGTHHVLFMKPQTYMNNSGEAIAEAASFYKIPIENIIVIVDDIYLAPGVLRIREKGSSGGHNGLNSIVEHFSSDGFPRLRVGVGERPSKEYDLASWVTGNIPKDDLCKMADCFERINNSLEDILDKKFADVMGKCNGKAKG